MEQVSWNDVQVFIERLNDQSDNVLKKGGPIHYLPEAQWEHACRAGTTTTYSWGNSISVTDGNYNSNILQTRDVGQYAANPWGFFDLHGNISEWTLRIGMQFTAETESVSDQTSSGTERVDRGGALGNSGSIC